MKIHYETNIVVISTTVEPSTQDFIADKSHIPAAGAPIAPSGASNWQVNSTRPDRKSPDIMGIFLIFSRELRQWTLIFKGEYFPQFVFRAKRGRKIAENFNCATHLIPFSRSFASFAGYLFFLRITHQALDGRTPQDIYDGIPALQTNFETRGKNGVQLKLSVSYFQGRKHLPIVSLQKAA